MSFNTQMFSLFDWHLISYEEIITTTTSIRG
jgi:hypothetical protein